ncbi:mediator of RNA polymerase II transcription subunit 9-like [Rhodamnia argentea]|uniref:Mediator of RNA polymerase II transcription subunit 9 n=1 Tax=Rhodamnia argentea TaxID=178133 RepID=A0A8B8NSZ4_9MYRT|nr:mediator of RNA polymerase II transcription subunit 9-like [Rhodamnia argentea]
MEHSFSGGSWNVIPSMATHSNVSTPTSHDHLYLQQQPPDLIPQQQQPFHQFQPQLPQFQQHPQFPQQQQQQQRFVQQQQQHQSLASHFHLLHLVESLADAVENGTRDQHSDSLVSELNNQFEKCQQLLNSIAGSISSKAVTVEGQKRKLEEAEQMLNQRRDLIASYRNSVEELIKSEP